MIKNPIPDEILSEVRKEAEKNPGFILMHSSLNGKVETTISYWRTKLAIQEWSQNEIHKIAKQNKSYYYEWHHVEILENQEIAEI